MQFVQDEFKRCKLPEDGGPNADAVKKFRADLESFQSAWAKLSEAEVEKLLGKPRARPAKTYAVPVAQPRVMITSGVGVFGEAPMDHKEFYPVGDGAGIEVWYGRGNTPEVVIVYLKVDEAFRKLPEEGLKERLAWDQERFTKLAKVIEDRQRKK